jgi:hypothetical protein
VVKIPPKPVRPATSVTVLRTNDHREYLRFCLILELFEEACGVTQA